MPAQTTAAIPYNATAEDIQQALEALNSIGQGQIICQEVSGGAFTIEFTGRLGNRDIASLTAHDSGLTGGSTPAVTVTTVQEGTSASDRIAAALQSVLDYLAALDQVSFLQDKLPLINQSLADVIGLESRFTKLVDDFRNRQSDTLVALKDQLSTALGVPVTFTADGDALKIGFDFSAAVDRQFALNLDLDSLGLNHPGLDTLGALADVRGDGKFRLAAGATLHIDLGIDLANPENPQPFLYADSTTAGLNAKVWGKDLKFTASVLSLGLSIGIDGNAGWVAVDSDGQAENTYEDTDRASYALSLADTSDGTSDGKIYLSPQSQFDLQDLHAEWRHRPISHPSAGLPGE